MAERWEAVVVGAGIAGLAAAYELRRRGVRVLVLEAEGVGAGQSAGLARVFRGAHRGPELGAGRLLGDEGLVVAGETAHGEAMRAAGVEPVPLTRREIAERIPFLRPPWESGLWDGLAGSLRIRRALTALARQVPVRQATV